MKIDRLKPVGHVAGQRIRGRVAAVVRRGVEVEPRRRVPVTGGAGIVIQPDRTAA